MMSQRRRRSERRHHPFISRISFSASTTSFRKKPLQSTLNFCSCFYLVFSLWTICIEFGFQQRHQVESFQIISNPSYSTSSSLREIHGKSSTCWRSYSRPSSLLLKMNDENNRHNLDGKADTETQEQKQSTAIKIGIAGAGAIAFGTASILSQNGFNNVMLWSPSGKGLDGFRNNDNQERENFKSLIATGAIQHEFIPQIAQSCQQLVVENSIVIMALPANGHKFVFDAMAPYLSATTEQKHVIISSHASFGTLYLSKIIQEHRETQKQHNQNNHYSDPIVTAWSTTVCTARRNSAHSNDSNDKLNTVDVKTIRKSVDICTIPQQETNPALSICESLFNNSKNNIKFQPRNGGLLSITLSNVNPQNHLAMALGNISRMEKGELWYQFDNTTPCIGRYLEGLDEERLNIANEVGVDVKTIYEHFSISFHVPQKGSIADMCQEIYMKGNDVNGPNTSNSRYITEDCPYGVALIVALGRLVNKPAILHESGLNICNVMYGRDFMAENDILKALNFDQMSLKDLQEAVVTGKIPSKRQLSSSSV